MHSADLKTSTSARTIKLDDGPLRIEDIIDIARGRPVSYYPIRMNSVLALPEGADFLDRLLREEGTIYGVTTGYGDSCTVTVPLELVAELPRHLYTYHGCGLGEYLSNRCWMWLPKTPHDCVTQTML